MKNAIFKNPNGSLIYTAICDLSLDSQSVADGLIAAGTLPVGCTLVGVDLIMPDGISVDCCEHDPVSGMILARPTHAHKLKNGQWVIDPAVEAQALADKKAAALVELSHLHADYLAKKTGNPTAPDMASWEFKKSLALTIKSGAPVDEGDATYLRDAGVTDFAAWADGILAKRQAYQTALGRADYLRGVHKSAIRLTASKDELDALMIDVGIGWDDLAKQP